MENSTTFWEYQNKKKKWELLQKAWALLSTSIKKGWGMVVIEAKALSIYIEECQKGNVSALTIPETNPTPNFWARCRNLEKQVIRNEAKLSGARFIKTEAFDTINGYDKSLTAAEDYDLDDRLRKANFLVGTPNLNLEHWENASPAETTQKEYYYDETLHRYISKNPRDAYQRFNPLRGVYIEEAKSLLAQPHLMFGLTLLKTIDYAAGLTGLFALFLNRTNKFSAPH